MVDRWVQITKDAWRKQAKASGYRARSAFKLKQIQERHKIIKLEDSVLDVGCHPGGWAQVAVELVGSKGKVVVLIYNHVYLLRVRILSLEILLTPSHNKRYSTQ